MYIFMYILMYILHSLEEAIYSTKLTTSKRHFEIG